jgi:hypothetical protein
MRQQELAMPKIRSRITFDKKKEQVHYYDLDAGLDPAVTSHDILFKFKLVDKEKQKPEEVTVRFTPEDTLDLVQRLAKILLYSKASKK